MKKIFSAFIYYLNCLSKYKYFLLLLNSFLFFFFGMSLSFDFDMCFCENNETKMMTQEEKDDLKVSFSVFLKVLKFLIMFSFVAGFVIMLPFLILMWDMANAHRYESYMED